MAIGQTRSTESVAVFNKFTGVSSVRLVAVNPNKLEIKALTGRELESEPEYVKTGVKYKDPVTQQESECTRTSIELYLKDEELDEIFIARFGMIDKPRKSKEGKAQVIDKYGRTCWVTADQYKNKELPVYKNGPAKIDATSWTLAYQNEENLIKFLRTYLDVPSADVWDKESRTFVENKNLASAVLHFDDVKKFFKGDFTELKDICKLYMKNKVKILLGVREYEGKMYQDVFLDEFIPNYAQPDVKTGEYAYIKRAVEAAQSQNMYVNTHFSFGLVKLFEGVRSVAGSNQEDAAQQMVNSDSPF